MRIGADGSWMRWPGTGIGRYSDGLLHAIEGRLGGDELHVYYNSLPGPPLFEGGAREHFIRMPRATLWNQVRLPAALRADACDVYLGTGLVVPVAPGPPSVVVVHDCLAFRLPWAKPGPLGRYWRRWTKASARRARVVIADSHDTAADCVRLLGVDAARVRVVWPGLEEAFGRYSDRDAGSAADLLAVAGHDGGAYVLQVGAYDPHKGGAPAREAIGILRRRGHDVTLVQCGPFGPSGASREAGVVHLGVVPEGTLQALYAAATVVWVPSLYEGFGLPVLEAMSLGRPVVASRVGGLPDAGGEVARYVPPGDADALAAATDDLLRDAAGREQLGAAGRAHAACFTWARAAGQVMDILAEAAGA